MMAYLKINAQKRYIDRQKELNAYGKIYKISFLNNPKIYIGSTIRTVSERFHEHRHRNNSKNLIYQVINSISIQECILEILDYAYSKTELNELEDKYILENNSLYPNGLNITLNKKGYKLPNHCLTNFSKWKIGKKRPASAKISENRTRAEKYTNSDGTLFHSEITGKDYKRSDAMRTAEGKFLNKRKRDE